MPPGRAAAGRLRPGGFGEELKINTKETDVGATHPGRCGDRYTQSNGKTQIDDSNPGSPLPGDLGLTFFDENDATPPGNVGIDILNQPVKLKSMVPTPGRPELAFQE